MKKLGKNLLKFAFTSKEPKTTKESSSDKKGDIKFGDVDSKQLKPEVQRVVISPDFDLALQGSSLMVSKLTHRNHFTYPFTLQGKRTLYVFF